jgi:hypothetical protein
MHEENYLITDIHNEADLKDDYEYKRIKRGF